MIEEKILNLFNVSRETLSSLQEYESLLRRWQKSINLVSQSTLDNIWERHILDSVQLLPYIPESTNIIADLGSGAGFPGLVLALCGEGRFTVHLVESDTRKGVFLQEVIRKTGANAKLHSERIERLSPLNADVVTARALAPLPKLWSYATRHLSTSGMGLFLKGQNVEKEQESLKKDHPGLEMETFSSLTEDRAVIVKIQCQQEG